MPTPERCHLCGKVTVKYARCAACRKNRGDIFITEDDLAADRLLQLTAERGTTMGTLERFYQHLSDDEIADLDQANTPALARAIGDALIALYCAWLEEMSEEERMRLFQHNDHVNGANRNWLLFEPEFAPYNTLDN